MDMRASGVHVETRGRGRAVALLHGWAMHGGLLETVADALADAHRVHVVDLPGHGHSAPLRPWTVDGVVRALENRFATEAAPIDVVGWSLGAIVAIAWAHAHPARVRRLVLVSATPKFVAADGWPHAMSHQTLRRFADELRVAYRPTLQRFLTLQTQGSDEARRTLAGLRALMFSRGEPDADVLRGALDALAGSDVRELAPRIRAPALVVAGDRDTLAPADASRWLAAALPDARLAIIAGAAHAPFLSHAREFDALVREFLRDV